MLWKDSGGGEFEQPPAGTHMAVCIRVIDIGTQDGEYQGKPTIKRQCIIGWELPGELMQEGEHAGKPFVCSKFYTASLSEKANLRKHLESWRGRAFTADELNGFDSKNILGKSCMLSLITNDKGKTQVAAVMAAPKGTQVGTPSNKLTFFSLDHFDAQAFESLSDGIKKMIVLSPEYKRATTPRQELAAPKKTFNEAMDEIEDDIPF